MHTGSSTRVQAHSHVKGKKMRFKYISLINYIPGVTLQEEQQQPLTRGAKDVAVNERPYLNFKRIPLRDIKPVFQPTMKKQFLSSLL